nr:hypothetical protein [Tanacetum cinerariifolium]
MRLGTRPDTFYTERGEIGGFTVDLHDIPGGADAFELCAKFCYGIKIDLSAHNIVPAIFREGNFVSKLEVFFDSYILEGWKDAVVAFETIDRHSDEPQVCWSYTYTRPRYAHRKHHKSAPKDWWTEDIADLNIDLFRCVINTLRSTNMLPPQLIGEALHVYACRWLPDVIKSRNDRETSTASQMTQEESVKRIKQLEMIVSLIPEDRGSVSVGFLIRLLSMENFLRASPVICTHLIKKCSLQLEEATINDLTLPLHESSGDNPIYDIELVEAVLKGFVTQWRKLILDCQKLSAEACAHAIKNDRLPLRTVVQILFFEQGKHGGKATSRHESQENQLQSQATKPTETTRDTQILLQQSSKADDAIRRSGPSSTCQMLEPESESQQKSREKEVRKTGSDKVRETMEEVRKQEHTKTAIQRSKSERHQRSK